MRFLAIGSAAALAGLAGLLFWLAASPRIAAELREWRRQRQVARVVDAFRRAGG